MVHHHRPWLLHNKGNEELPLREPCGGMKKRRRHLLRLLFLFILVSCSVFLGPRLCFGGPFFSSFLCKLPLFLPQFTYSFFLLFSFLL